MTELILIIGCFGAGLVAGVIFAARRLRGDRSTAEAAKAAILGAGGAGPRKPW